MLFRIPRADYSHLGRLDSVRPFSSKPLLPPTRPLHRIPRFLDACKIRQLLSRTLCANFGQATATLVTIIFGVIALPTTAYGYYQISKDKAMHDEVKRAFATLWAKFPWASGRPEDDVEFIPPQPKLSDINRNFNRRLDDVEKGLALLNAAMDTDDLKKVIEALKKPINDINDTLRKQARERLEKLLEVAMAHKREAESNASGGSEQGTAATAGVKAKPMSDKRARFLTELREEREKKGKEKQAVSLQQSLFLSCSIVALDSDAWLDSVIL